MSASAHAGIRPTKEASTCQGDPPPRVRHPPKKETPKEAPPQKGGPPKEAPQEGGTPQEGNPHRRRHPPEGGTPQEGGTPPGGTPQKGGPPQKEAPTPQKGGTSQRRHPPRSRLRHAVNEQPVRILLECILVYVMFSAVSVCPLPVNTTHDDIGQLHGPPPPRTCSH